MNSQYPRGTLGHVLDALRDWGIPEIIAGTVTFGKYSLTSSQQLYYGENLFAEYKYFDGIEQPLFRWHMNASSYGTQRMVRQDDNTLKPAFRLSLGVHNNASLVIEGDEATPELHRFLLGEALTNWMDRPGYKLSKESGAFFQGGSDNPEGKWFYIEFWEPQGAQAFVDFVNENFKPKT